jgi:hypothetical protein
VPICTHSPLYDTHTHTHTHTHTRARTHAHTHTHSVPPTRRGGALSDALLRGQFFGKYTALPEPTAAADTDDPEPEPEPEPEVEPEPAAGLSWLAPLHVGHVARVAYREGCL